MKIIVFSSNGTRIYLDVEPYDTIENCKAKIQDKVGIPPSEIVLHFNGEILEDDKTLDNYDIEENSIIIFLIKFRAGEFGGSAKIFVDPGKAGKKEIKISFQGPFYRAVDRGMNICGICENKNCNSAYKKEVIHPFGFGTFDLIKDMKDNPPVCPACEFPLRDVSTCAFFQCKYSYIGVKYEDEQLKNVNYSNSNRKNDAVDYFEPGKNGENYSTWLKLKIIAEEI
jgi:hypothetical protein